MTKGDLYETRLDQIKFHENIVPRKFNNFFLITMDVGVNLRVPRLILQDPEVNDRINLQ